MIHFGKISKKNEGDLTLRDLLRHPIWISRSDLAISNPSRYCYFPVLAKEPEITKEMVKRKYRPEILVRVPGRKLYARASYWPDDRCIIGIYFWRRNKWI